MRNSGSWREKAWSCFFAVFVCAVLTICYRYGKWNEQTRIPAEPGAPLTEEEFRQEFPHLSITYADRETEAGNPQLIDLSAVDGEVEITKGGAYLLQGETSGRIRINAEEQTVYLLLNGAKITVKQGPALSVKSAGKVILSLQPGSENTFVDSGDYRGFLEEESCIFSTTDITINGTGKLNIYGFYKDAIHSKDVVRILDYQFIYPDMERQRRNPVRFIYLRQR